MSYKTEFAANNTDLQTILDMVNGLPDKVKACKVYVKIVSETTTGAEAKVTVGDATYFASTDVNPDTIIEVESGTEITLHVKGVASYASYATITIDGEKVVSSAGIMGVNYTHTVTDDITIELSIAIQATSYTGAVGAINVVTGEIEGDADVSLVPETETSTFTPTDSGGTTYKSKFADNNVDLQKILELVHALERSEESQTAIITITSEHDSYSTNTVTIDGVTYNTSTAGAASWTETVEVPIGTEITLTSYRGSSSSGSGGIYVNDTRVEDGTSTGTYTYTYDVIGDATIHMTSTGDSPAYRYGTITITDSAVTLIPFSIQGTSYQAEEGMTWAEWVASSYNTGGYLVSGNYILNSSETWVVMNGGICAKTTDTISSGQNYALDPW